MLFADGEQRMNKWPQEISALMRQKGFTEKDYLYSQSQESKHCLSAVRLKGKKWFFGYNQALQIFVAWHLDGKVEKGEGDERIRLGVPGKILRAIKNTPNFDAMQCELPLGADSKIMCDVRIMSVNEFLAFVLSI